MISHETQSYCFLCGRFGYNSHIMIIIIIGQCNCRNGLVDISVSMPLRDTFDSVANDR